MQPIYPTTELEAVNDMLSVLGEAPISTLEEVGRSDAAVAVALLRTTSRIVQAQGWTWNTNTDVKLTPSFPDGFLYVPQNTLKVDSSGANRNDRVVQRGVRLWDRDNNTFKFTESVTVDLVLGLAFDEIPQTARTYITLRAGRVYQDRFLGSELISAFSTQDEFAAMVDVMHEETESGDYTLATSGLVSRIQRR